MKKELLILLSLTVAVACSSSPRASDEDFPEPEIEGGDPYQSPAQTNRNTKQSPPAAKREKKEEEPQLESGTTTRSDAQVLVDAVRSGNDEAIAKAATMVLAKNPNDPKALNALGYYHYKKAHYPAAQMMFDKALKVDPHLSEAHNNLGLTLLAENENRDAIKEFRKAIEVNSEDGVAAANLGSIYIENKDYGKALVAMELAYRKNSKDPKIANNYGIALTANKKYSEAKDVYKQALSLSSSNRDIMLNYAILLIEDLNQPQEGLDLLSKVRFLGPSPEARNRINLLENKAKAGLK